MFQQGTERNFNYRPFIKRQCQTSSPPVAVVHSVWGGHLEKNCEQRKLTSPTNDAFVSFPLAVHVKVLSRFRAHSITSAQRLYPSTNYVGLLCSLVVIVHQVGQESNCVLSCANERQIFRGKRKLYRCIDSFCSITFCYLLSDFVTSRLKMFKNVLIFFDKSCWNLANIIMTFSS